ncbi:hypothetical protein RLEG3_12635 [Rhizobium leguminosarum bv. trifolii WSM1689]|nr:hypothetical protein RLEG3_12635 [Rhizobium leguminosarum bv. trifolii WSM1689]
MTLFDMDVVSVSMALEILVPRHRFDLGCLYVALFLCCGKINERGHFVH